MKNQEQTDVVVSGSAGETTFTFNDDITIDLGNYGAACDTITLDSLTSATMNTITLPSISYGNGVGIGAVGSGGSGGSYYISSQPSTSWTTTVSPTVNIDTDGINVKETGDIKIGNKSLKDFISKMEDRLAILQPAPEKLEKFEALRKAYEHYKLMEKLCQEDSKEDNK